MTREELLLEITNYSNKKLLNLYTKFVQVHWYDPHETPLEIRHLYNNNIYPDDLQKIVLSRMKSFKVK